MDDELTDAFVTPELIRALMTSPYQDPWLVRWTETGDLEVVAGPLLQASTHLVYDVHYYVLSTADDARKLVDMEPDDVLTDAREAALLRLLSEGGPL